MSSIWNISLRFITLSDAVIKFSSILKEFNVKPCVLFCFELMWNVCFHFDMNDLIQIQLSLTVTVKF